MGAFFIIPSPGRETSRQRRLQGTERKRGEEAIGGQKEIDGGERDDLRGEIGRGQRVKEREIE